MSATARSTTRRLLVVAGDIGDDQKEYEFEPLTAPEPLTVPTPAPEPVKAPEREPVPA